ncbi:F0F1 ATP synthase subunit epsilon [Methylomonas paludis]|uniref:ATP synthase epsilon chain n=1 Tax=Methylomonas paludis TaxID=1173101 RepID=A0A975ML44_9GAMM|nr:F0F1 ATP synthase subunit epsilon [Methylomonas paludis]QWF69414.1 F0F1 ATP synthase subunit epsilon [Methylomonas paludis]
MQLKVLLPYQILVDVAAVTRIVAETAEGSFGLLPRRLDCVAALTPGILIYQTANNVEQCLAIDEGVLVKTGPQVLVSVRRAIVGADLAELRRLVEREFLILDEQAKALRAVNTKLEAGFLRRFAALQHE